jgi:oligosaccharide repeat unit polymerase
MLLMMGGLLSMAVGYLVGPKKSPQMSFLGLETDHWNQKRLTLVAVILLLVSGFALTSLIELTGGLTLENLSAKRFEAQVIEEYYGRGYLRLMAGISELAVYLLVAQIVSGKHLQVGFFFLLVIGIGLSLFVFIYQSSRGKAVFVLINILAIIYYLRREKIGFFGLANIGVMTLIFIQILTYLRGDRYLSWSLILDSLNLTDAIQSVILNRNFVDMSKTAHIISAIPDTIEYQWGRTFLLWTVAWIPRSLWHGKPITSIGQFLGPTVFGTSTRIGGGGVPPGIIAELYWNFSIPGVVLGSFVIGYFLRFIYVYFSARSGNRSFVLLYVVGLMKLGMTLLGGDLTRTIVDLLTNVVPLYLILFFVTERSSVSIRSVADP